MIQVEEEPEEEPAEEDSEDKEEDSEEKEEAVDEEEEETVKRQHYDFKLVLLPILFLNFFFFTGNNRQR